MLEKLTLFRKFYVTVVVYIYFTRIVVFLLQSTLEYEYFWVSSEQRGTSAGEEGLMCWPPMPFGLTWLLTSPPPPSSPIACICSSTFCWPFPPPLTPSPPSLGDAGEPGGGRGSHPGLLHLDRLELPASPGERGGRMNWSGEGPHSRHSNHLVTSAFSHLAGTRSACLPCLARARPQARTTPRAHPPWHAPLLPHTRCTRLTLHTLLPLLPGIRRTVTSSSPMRSCARWRCEGMVAAGG